jgi:arylsulfatase A-like enzyme
MSNHAITRSPGTFAGLAVLGVAALVLASLDARGAERLPRPNFILILADDLGYGSPGCYGGQEARTPHLDRMAGDGVRLSDFHSNGPMCSPTRAALLTGRYPQRCAWVDDAELSPDFREQRRENVKQRWAWGMSREEVTLPAVLRTAGYRTALVGKWHLGYDAAFHPMNHGFDEFRGFVGGAVDYHTHAAEFGRKELDWWRDRQVEDDPGYTTDLLTRYATDFIGRNRDTPFFLYLAHAAPHVPLQGRDPARTLSPPAAYREMIEALDDSVGAILRTVREQGLASNTLVVFCSDNGAQPPRGVAANGPLRGAKGSLFEGGHRVPCLVTWPGTLPAGRVCAETVMTMDFFPTFAHLAGAALPKGHAIDGIDILPWLKGEAPAVPRTLHWRFADQWAVRRGPWKLIGQDDTPRTLVNLEDDAGEQGNVLSQQPARADELMKLHRAWSAEVGTR